MKKIGMIIALMLITYVCFGKKLSDTITPVASPDADTMLILGFENNILAEKLTISYVIGYYVGEAFTPVKQDVIVVENKKDLDKTKDIDESTTDYTDAIKDLKINESFLKSFTKANKK